MPPTTPVDVRSVRQEIGFMKTPLGSLASPLKANGKKVVSKKDHGYHWVAYEIEFTTA